MNSSRRGFLAAVGAATLAGCNASGPTTVTEVGGETETDGDGTDGGGETVTEEPPATGSNPAATADQRFVDVYESVAPSVVSLRVYDEFGPAGQGSGWLLDDGVVVTNEHVVAVGETVRVQFRDGTWTDAEVVGTDVYSDLAAVSVPTAPEEATPLSTTTADPTVGAEVAVIGSPFGLGGSLTTGVVSGVDRSIMGVSSFDIPDAIQTDAAVNPGNSGGPMVDLDGTVRGVISQGGGENLGFAVSTALADRVVPALLETGEYAHPFMGVGLRQVTPLLAAGNGLDRASGVYVDRVLPDGPAAVALRGTEEATSVEGVSTPVGGDVIRALDDEPIETTGDLSTYLALEKRPDESLSVTVLRDGASETVSMTLGERPDPVGR